MDPLKIKWHKRAQVYFDAINRWYLYNLGEQAASHFSRDTLKATVLLSHFPMMGTADATYSKGKRIYYSFLFHPKYRIVYRFTQKALYIVALCATMMNSK